jgi:hypothetical protein
MGALLRPFCSFRRPRRRPSRLSSGCFRRAALARDLARPRLDFRRRGPSYGLFVGPGSPRRWPWWHARRPEQAKGVSRGPWAPRVDGGAAGRGLGFHYTRCWWWCRAVLGEAGALGAASGRWEWARWDAVLLAAALDVVPLAALRARGAFQFAGTLAGRPRAQPLDLCRAYRACSEAPRWRSWGRAAAGSPPWRSAGGRCRRHATGVAQPPRRSRSQEWARRGRLFASIPLLVWALANWVTPRSSPSCTRWWRGAAVLAGAAARWRSGFVPRPPLDPRHGAGGGAAGAAAPGSIGARPPGRPPGLSGPTRIRDQQARLSCSTIATGRPRPRIAVVERPAAVPACLPPRGPGPAPNGSTLPGGPRKGLPAQARQRQPSGPGRWPGCSGTPDTHVSVDYAALVAPAPALPGGPRSWARSGVVLGCLPGRLLEEQAPTVHALAGPHRTRPPVYLASWGERPRRPRRCVAAWACSLQGRR